MADAPQQLARGVRERDGVYKARFSRRQSAYERAVGELFAVLDERLASQRFLFGPQPLETLPALDFEEPAGRAQSSSSW